MNWKMTDWFQTPHIPLSDRRLSEVKHTETEIPLKYFNTLGDWEEYCRQIRKQMMFSIGLLPDIERGPLNEKVFDVLDFGEFKVAKVIFESMPGFYVTGNLYLPQNASPSHPVPMVLNPHGHWDGAKLELSEITRIPVRCANFALRGMAAFVFDMVGYGDNRQIGHLDYCGYEKELWNENILGIQVYNCIRALDFVETLPEIDRLRIGSTGASGGGTQTFWLAALDDRVKVTMPVNMVSTLFQGGCACEAAPNLHLTVSNIEIAALTAPRPMKLAGSTGDWTQDLPEKTFPWLKHIYQLYGEEEQLEYFYREGPHGYETSAQEAAYDWFSRKLLGKTLPSKECEIEFEDINFLRVTGIPSGNSAVADAGQLFEQRKKEHTISIQELSKSKEGLETIRSLLTYTIGKGEEYNACSSQTVESGCYTIEKRLLQSSTAQLPLAIVREKRQDTLNQQRLVLVFSGKGKRFAFRKLEQTGMLQLLLQQGFQVAALDVFLTGEYRKPYGQSGRDFSMPADYHFGEFEHYITTFNRTDDAYRVQDTIGASRYFSKATSELVLVGLDDASLWVMSALPFLSGVSAAVLEEDMSCWEDDDFVERFFLPGFLAAGGMESCKQLSGTHIMKLEDWMEELKSSK